MNFATKAPTEMREVIIPPGTNWNQEPPPETSPNNRLDIIDNEIVDNLPETLREGVYRLVEENDKRVFLVSALAVLSGVMPNVAGYYDGKQISPNLFAFIVGDYGTGKGAAQYARCLIEEIEEELERQNEAYLMEWQQLEPEEKRSSKPRREGLM